MKEGKGILVESGRIACKDGGMERNGRKGSRQERFYVGGRREEGGRRVLEEWEVCGRVGGMEGGSGGGRMKEGKGELV